MINEEHKYEVEKILKSFWLDHGKTVAVNARHTTVNVEPKPSSLFLRWYSMRSPQKTPRHSMRFPYPRRMMR